ncbi:MAG: hypothetical protein ACPHCI_08245 [Solirubrobacterales bacterium]
MTDVATLLGEFLDELNAGNRPEAAAFLDKADTDADRIELAQGIEAVLAFAPDSARHPRDASSGVLVSPVDATELAAVIDEVMQASSELAEAVPSWRERFGASVADFAGRVLEAGGLAPTEGNVGVASRWIEGIESGAIGAERLSDRAMRAVSSVLGAGPEPAFPPGMDASLEVAFRAEENSRDSEVADKLDGIAEVLGEAMIEPTDDVDVEAWFSGDK